MSHWMNSMIAIDTAARSARGDYAATMRATARFCTESLVDAATTARAGMTAAERSKFVSSSEFSYGCNRRDVAVAILCGYVSAIALREWSAAYTAQRDAAIVADLQARVVRW